MNHKIVCFIIVAFCCTASAKAQGVSVGIINFKAGVGLSQQDIDGVSAIFTTYVLNPSEYTLIERSQIDKLIEEQNLQRSTLTDSEMVRLGKIMNLSYIIVGDINLVMGEYNIDVRLINVENGSIIATEGASWTSGMSYRAVMQKIAENLKSKISVPKTSNRSELNEIVGLLDRAIENQMWNKAIEYTLKVHSLLPNHYVSPVILGKLYGMVKDDKSSIEKSNDYYNNALLLLDKDNYIPFKEICDVVVPFLDNSYILTVRSIYFDMAQNYMQLKMFDKAAVFQKKLIDIDSRFIDETNEPVRLLAVYNDYLLYTSILSIQSRQNKQDRVGLLEKALDILTVLTNKIELLKVEFSQLGELCNKALSECYNQQFHLYVGIYYDGFVPPINQCNSKLKDVLIKAAQYGNNDAINILNKEGIKF